MANLVAMNMKRKEHAEVANNGLSIFLDPKRLKLQDGEIPDMMEEEKPSAETPPLRADQAAAAEPMTLRFSSGSGSLRRRRAAVSAGSFLVRFSLSDEFRVFFCEKFHKYPKKTMLSVTMLLNGQKPGKP
uniref:Uncharacterized protein n=1 Tax=Oryza rufipogon TaxID=4529 RepID=A0A0E0QYH7_ORYRU